MRAESFGDVVLVPGEKSDGLPDGNKLEAKLHLTAEPDMIAHYAVLSWVGATFPDLSAKKK